MQSVKSLWRRVLVYLVLILALTTAGAPFGVPGLAQSANAAGSTPVYGYKLIHIYRHDPGAFTEGMMYAFGYLYEGTGRNGQSELRKVDTGRGTVVQSRRTPNDLFGEGITLNGNTIVELTWKARTGFVYDAQTFRLLRTFGYNSEGWGITNDGSRLIMSDGTATLHFLNRSTYKQIGTVQVTDQGRPVTRLNELEYIDGQIWANVWLTDRIAIINPSNGNVTAWVDLTRLRPDNTKRNPDAVLNGIAFDPRYHRIFVTGKLWNILYEIQLVRN